MHFLFQYQIKPKFQAVLNIPDGQSGKLFQGVFSFNFLLQLLWAIELKFSQVCYFNAFFLDYFWIIDILSFSSEMWEIVNYLLIYCYYM